jgi:hypothetical protein
MSGGERDLETVRCGIGEVLDTIGPEIVVFTLLAVRDDGRPCGLELLDRVANGLVVESIERRWAPPLVAMASISAVGRGMLPIGSVGMALIPLGQTRPHDKSTEFGCLDRSRSPSEAAERAIDEVIETRECR